MRFTKRAKSPLAWGRRTEHEDYESSTFAPVASEERDALLAVEELESPDDSAGYEPDEAEAMPPTNPTQRLLTALGRFERQVAKARGGAPQSEWSDECMNQLIRAVEVALDQGWPDTVEALTETARVLQSYENVDLAPEAVPFLADSYEILCLMVGDLIVGNVRSAVLQKWRARYQQALDDMAAAGIALVDDDNRPRAASAQAHPDNSFEAAEAAADEPGSPSAAPFDPAPLSDEAGPEPEAMPRLDDFGAPAGAAAPFELGDLRQAAESHEAGLDPVASFAIPDEPGRHRSVLRALVFPTNGEPAVLRPEPMETDPVSARIEPAGGDVLFQEPPAPDAEGPDPAADAVPPAPEDPTEEADSGLPLGGEAVLQRQLDTMCDGLACMEHGGGGETREALGVVEGVIAYLESHAQEHGQSAAAEACRVMQRLCTPVRARHEVLDADFYEVAYGFCEVYMDTARGIDRPAMSQWRADAEAVAARYALALPEVEAVRTSEAPAVAGPEASVDGEAPAGAAAKAAVAEAEAEGDDDRAAAVRLLESARAAMASGDVYVAKRLALEAAANIAKAESTEAQLRLRKAEQRLQESNEAITRAHGDVEHAEDAVKAAEEAVRSSDTHLAQQQEQVTAANSVLTDVQARVADLEAQIRELEAKRDEALRNQEEAAGLLNEEEQKAAQAVSELEARRQAERKAREQLEDMRQSVKNLHQKRSAIESAMDKARDELARQQASLADIEETLAQLGEKDDTESNGPADDLLF